MKGKDVLLFFLSIGFCVIGQQYKVVNTTQGPIKGYRGPEGVFAFYGIPYATTPTGIYKFQAPLPPPTWTETLEAVDQGIACPQVPFIHEKPYTIRKNCLIANVFIPDTEETNLSVVVYVHGGGYNTFYGNYRTPYHAVSSKNVIVVTINYRLGIHGFLCLGTKLAPGNAALKDQVAALRWVNKNIVAFGGNPNDVTLAGFSAGTSCVDLLALSPATDGLINKVIIDSVVSLNIPIIANNPLENAKIFAAHLGFNNTDDIFALEKFYTDTPLKQLINYDNFDVLQLRMDTTFLFAPCVERNNDDEEVTIVTEPTADILNKGTFKRLPMMFGIATMEGSFRESMFEGWINEINEEFHKFMPGTLEFENNDQRDAVASMVKNFYFGNKPVSNDDILKFIEFISDAVFLNSMFRTVNNRLAAGHDQIYMYYYTFVSDDDSIISHTNVRGAAHCAETYAVLDGTSSKPQANETDISDELKQMKILIRDIWANFVKTGSPVTPGSSLSWPPVGPGLVPHMEMTLPPRLQQQWDEKILERMRLWDYVYGNFTQKPTPPPNPPNL